MTSLLNYIIEKREIIDSLDSSLINSDWIESNLNFNIEDFEYTIINSTIILYHENSDKIKMVVDIVCENLIKESIVCAIFYPDLIPSTYINFELNNLKNLTRLLICAKYQHIFSIHYLGLWAYLHRSYVTDINDEDIEDCSSISHLVHELIIEKLIYYSKNNYSKNDYIKYINVYFINNLKPEFKIPYIKQDKTEDSDVRYLFKCGITPRGLHLLQLSASKGYLLASFHLTRFIKNKDVRKEELLKLKSIKEIDSYLLNTINKELKLFNKNNVNKEKKLMCSDIESENYSIESFCRNIYNTII